MGKELIVVITLIVVGLALLVLIAIVVGVVDRASAAGRRFVAQERRQRWESRYF